MLPGTKCHVFWLNCFNCCWIPFFGGTWLLLVVNLLNHVLEPRLLDKVVEIHTELSRGDTKLMDDYQNGLVNGFTKQFLDQLRLLYNWLRTEPTKPRQPTKASEGFPLRFRNPSKKVPRLQSSMWWCWCEFMFNLSESTNKVHRSDLFGFPHFVGGPRIPWSNHSLPKNDVHDSPNLPHSPSGCTFLGVIYAHAWALAMAK